MASFDDFISDQELLSLSTGESLSNIRDKSDSDISLTVNVTVGNGATDKGTGGKLTGCGLNIMNEDQTTSTNTIHELKHCIETKKNPKTIRKTDQCTRRFLSFLHEKKVET